MAQDEKPQPSITPQDVSLVDRLPRAFEDEAFRRSIALKLTVRGGLPSKKYSFEFAASGDGSASCRFDDQLKSRKAEGGTQTRLSDKEFVALLRKVLPAIARPTERPSFLPDTVIGILEVSDGTSVRRIYFAADPEQAKTQNKVPAPEVRQAVDAVYAVGASLSGTRNMKL
jgi:hypothetical protein